MLQSTPPHRKCHVSDRQNRKRISTDSRAESGLKSPPSLVPVSCKKIRGHHERNKQNMVKYAKSAAISSAGLFENDDTQPVVIPLPKSRPSLSTMFSPYMRKCQAGTKSRICQEHSEELLNEYYGVMFEWMCSMDELVPSRKMSRLSVN